MGLSITYGSRIVCPNCRKEVDFEVKGFFKQFLVAPLVNGVLERLKKEGGTVTCGKCKHKFAVSPQP